MASYVEIGSLASLVRSKRGERGLREIAKITNISASTISRVEKQQMPDLDTFLALCDWLEVPPQTLIKNTKNISHKKTHSSICAELRSDPKLDNDIANALAILIEAAYHYQL